MKCIVCNSDIQNNKCPKCGFIIETESNNIFKRIFTKNTSKESFSMELKGIISFRKWLLDLFNKDEYINRKSVKELYDKELEN